MSVSQNIVSANKILDKSLFLFGAGATKDAGCLISIEMLDDIYKMDLSKPEREAIDFLLSSLQYHASWKNLKENKGVNGKNGHQPNIEDLMLLIRRIVNRDSYLPFPITGSWADKINFLETEWRSTDAYLNLITKKSLFVNLEDKLTRRLSHWLKLGEEDTSYLNPIIEFLQETETNSPPIKFFTLNYDLVFEKHFNKEGVTLLDTGFINGIYSGFNINSDRDHRISYYKLHGSINWERDDAGTIKEAFHYSSDPSLFSVRQSRENSDLIPVELFVSNSIGNPHVIFGQGGKFLSVDPFISLLYNFKELLTKREVFFVVGYSFFDPYINNMLLEGLSRESTKLMVVVNPHFHEEKFLTEEELKMEPNERNERHKNRFIDHLQAVQKSTYLSDLPSFNLTDISPNKVKLISSKAKEFFKYYFSSSSSGFKELEDEISAFEKEGEVFS